MYLYQRNAEPEATPTPVIGGDRNEHGCIGSAGYSWCEAKSKCLRIFEEFCPDAASNIVSGVKTASGVALTASGSTEFNWIVGEGETITDTKISGILYSAEGVLMADYNKIEKYMSENFALDNYNIADGVQGGLRGYYGNYMACNLNFRHAQLKKNSKGILEPVGDNLIVKLECGYFNKNDIPKLIVGQLIKEILAKKYKKAMGEVNVNITKMSDSHAAGGVKFTKDGQGEGGIFLAAKIDAKWQVVFDGNGSIDCVKMRQEYKFPDEILKPEFCD